MSVSEEREYQFFDMVMPVTKEDETMTVARVVGRRTTSSGAVEYEIEWQEARYHAPWRAWFSGKDLKPHIDTSWVEPLPPGAEAKSCMAMFKDEPEEDSEQEEMRKERNAAPAKRAKTETDDEEEEWARGEAEWETHRREKVERYKALRADDKRFYEIFGAEHGFYWLTEAELAEVLARPATSAHEAVKISTSFGAESNRGKRSLDEIDKLLAEGVELDIDDRWWFQSTIGERV